MISVQLNAGEKSGSATFAGDEVSEPCQVTTAGDFTLADVQAMFWLINLTAEGTGQGIYPMERDICAPYELLAVMALSAVEVSGVPQDWQEEIDAMASDASERFDMGGVA